MPPRRRFLCHYCKESVEPQQRLRAVVLVCYTGEHGFHAECLTKLRRTGRRPGAPSTRYAIVRIQDRET